MRRFIGSRAYVGPWGIPWLTPLSPTPSIGLSICRRLAACSERWLILLRPWVLRVDFWTFGITKTRKLLLAATQSCTSGLHWVSLFLPREGQPTEGINTGLIIEPDFLAGVLRPGRVFDSTNIRPDWVSRSPVVIRSLSGLRCFFAFDLPR